MADEILSQEEVDALLNDAEAEGQEEQAGAKDAAGTKMVTEEPLPPPEGMELYDFRRPNVLPDKQKRTFHGVHDDFAVQLTSKLSMMLRAQASVRVTSVVTHQYADFVQAMDTVTHMLLFSAAPLPGVGMMEFNLGLAMGMLDLLTGGNGKIESAIRKLTSLERSLFQPVEKLCFDALQAVLSEVIAVDIEQVRFETDPMAAEMLAEDSAVVVVTLDIAVEETHGTLCFCYPLAMAQAVLEAIDETKTEETEPVEAGAEENVKQKLFDSLQTVALPVSVTLGKARLRARDLLALVPGDIIVLDSKIAKPINFSVQGKTLFEAIPGERNGAINVKILRRHDK